MEPKYKYNRLPNDTACIYLAIGICKLMPKQTTYRAANYVLNVKASMLGLNQQMTLTVTDVKQTFEYSVLLSFVDCEARPTIHNADKVDYVRFKNILRRMLSTVILTDAA